MKPRSRTNWTREDEARFQEMAKQREEILAKNRQPVKDLVMDMLAGPPKTEEYFVLFIVKNAERFRDVLDPYDSRERQPKVSELVSPPMPWPAPAVSIPLNKNFGDL